MCAEASTVLRAVAPDFFFNCWCLEILLDNSIQMVTDYALLGSMSVYTAN
jgi:hypothetical protein